MTSYLKDDFDRSDALPAIINGRARGHTHSHHQHHSTVHSSQCHSDSEGARHVRFGPSHQPLSGSTSNLVSTSKEFVYHRSQSPTRKHVHESFTTEPGRMYELEDRLKLYKDELVKKDELISKLSDMESLQRRNIDINVTQSEEYSSERTQALANARSEAAALAIKVNGLSAQLNEVKSQLESRDEIILSLKREVETVRENEAKHVAIAMSLRERLAEHESQQDSFEGAQERHELVISSLKREKDDCNNRILDLESRIRHLIEDKESAVKNMVSFETRYREISNYFSSVFGISSDCCGTGDILDKLKGIVLENSTLKNRVSSLEQHIHSCEVDNKASRETIMRLVAEGEEKQSVASRYTVEIDRSKQDMELAIAKRREVESELVLMKERLEASQNAWASTRRELEEKASKFSHYSREAQESEVTIRKLETEHLTFMKSLAALLSDCQTVIEPCECQIRDRVEALVSSIRDKSSHTDLLDIKLRAVTEQLEKHSELQKSADRRAKRVESDYFEIEGKLRHMESELASEGILRDSLRHDKEKYMQFLERLCRMLKLDIIATDVGLDLVIDAIYGRCEQITKLELEAINEKQTQVYNQQRKLKSLKEQLESRDLHIDLLRKKVSALEERLAGKTELEREKDTEIVKSKKLMKLVEKYKRELQEAHLEIRDMKSQLLEGTQLKSRTMEAEGHIECLETQVDQLNQVRQKQAEKISKLRTDVEVKAENLATSLEQANHTIQSLTRELRTTKAGFEEAGKREKQLLDLRQVFARMLGLDVNALAVPDYEIIARLEKLILAHQSTAATTAAIDHAIVDMEDGFRQGYTQAGKVFVRARSPTRKSVTTTHVRRRSRARSMSPQRRKDNRAY